MEMFKRRKTKKAQAAKRAEVKPFDLPPAVNDHPVVLGLPDTSAFRTSLIMPHLSSRFELLREEDGTLVSLDKFQNALKHQRTTGFITEQEENALLHHFHLQAQREGITLPHMPRPLDESYMSEDSAGSEPPQSPSESTSQVRTPVSLDEFHRMRVASEGSSMFGHNGKELDRQRTINSPARSLRRGPNEESSNSLSSSAGPSSPPPAHLRVLESEQDEGDEEEGHSDVHLAPLPRSRSLRSQQQKQPWRLSRQDVQRLSRVLDDMVVDVTGRRATLPPQPELTTLTDQEPAYGRSSSEQQQFRRPDTSVSFIDDDQEDDEEEQDDNDDDAEEHIDPAYTPDGQSRMMHKASRSTTSLNSATQLSAALNANGQSRSPSLADSSPATLMANTPSPPPPASSSSSSANKLVNTPTLNTNVERLGEEDALHKLSTPDRQQGSGPNFQDLFPSPDEQHRAPADAFPSDQAFEVTPVAPASSARARLESPAAPSGLAGELTREPLEEPQPRLSTQRAVSEETSLSNMPSPCFSNNNQLANKRSVSSIGSSYCDDDASRDRDDTLSLEQDHVLFGGSAASEEEDQSRQQVLHRQDSTKSSNAGASDSFYRSDSQRTTSPYTPFEFDQLSISGRLNRSQTTSAPGTSIAEESGHSQEQEYEWATQPTAEEREQFLHGLHISDLSNIQKQLVLSASQRSGGRVLDDPSPQVAQRALFGSPDVSTSTPRASEDTQPDSEIDVEVMKSEHQRQDGRPSLGDEGQNMPKIMTAQADGEPLNTPSLLESSESPTDVSAPQTPAGTQPAGVDWRQSSSSLAKEVKPSQVPVVEAGPAYEDAVNQTPTSARGMPFGQYVAQEAESSTPTNNDSKREEIPTAQPRLQPPPSRPTANTSSVLIRSVAAQAEAATAALKSPPQAASSGRDSSPSGFQRMRTRKSSKNLKPSTISSPTFISSTANFDKAQQMSSPLSPEVQLRNQGSNSRLGRSAQQEQHGSGLNRFLSRLRKKPTSSDLASSHRSASAEPSGRLGAPLVLQSKDDRIMPAMSSAPPRTEFPTTTETHQHRKTESVGSTTSQADSPSKPSTPGRAPVSYDVAKSRKRAGSASRPSQQQSGSPSAVGSPSVNNGPWTPMDPEASMASWRSSMASSTGRPTSSAESVRKLQEAADALGLDSSRKDQLMADAAPTVETIPEEDSEYRFSKRKSNVVRRTIIVGPSASSTRISQLLQEAQEQSQSEEGESLAESSSQQPGQWPRAADQPSLRRAHTVSQMSRSSDGSLGHVPRHRKMSSDTISSRQSGYAAANRNSWKPSEAQSSLEGTMQRQPSRRKQFALRSSMTQSPSSSSNLSSKAADQARKSLRPGVAVEDDEILASGELPAAGKGSAKRMSANHGSVRPGDRLEINELDDGSFFWQVVRSKLRSERPTSEISAFSGFHSRSSSLESDIIPASPPPTANRIARPSVLDPKHNSNPGPQDMRLVFAHSNKNNGNNGSYHRRLRSNDGVGRLPYIRREAAQEQEQVRQRGESNHSMGSDVEVFEADDNVMSDLIEDLTASMDQGAFDLIRAESLSQRHQEASGSIPGLRLRSPT